MKLSRLMKQLKNNIKGVEGMMINFFAMQVEQGWITLEQVPRKYRTKVKELLELANAGLDKQE